jgi:hypothetical protein
VSGAFGIGAPLVGRKGRKDIPVERFPAAVTTTLNLLHNFLRGKDEMTHSRLEMT